MTTTPRHLPDPSAVIDALIQQGVDYSTAEDKAFQSKNAEAEAIAHGGYQATVKALAIVLGVEQAEANERIMLAIDNDQEN